MGYMADGNTAALNAYERQQAKDGQLWDANSERVLDDICDELFNGEKVKGYTLRDLLVDYLDPDDLFSVFRDQKRESMLEAHDAVTKRVRERIRDFFLNHEPEYIWERI